MTTASDFNRRIDELVADLGPVFAAKALEDFAEKARRADDDTEDTRTVHRRAAIWPTISRGNRDASAKDEGDWPTSRELREQCLPLIVAANGVVENAYEVRGWEKVGTKWRADLGRKLTTRELREMRAPYLPGDELPVVAPKAMWPCAVDVTGTVYRAGEPVKVWDPALGEYIKAYRD